MTVRAFLDLLRRQRLRIGRFRVREVALAVFVVLALFCAYRVGRAIIEQNRKASLDERAPSGFEREEHFPGAAYFYAEDAPAPARGVTGSTVLPRVPLLERLLGSDGSIRPAAPFSTARASPTDRGRALQCLTAAIYYEAGGEPVAGQRAVAQVILNRVRHPAFPASVCGVVYQGSAEARCQFSFACNGALARGMPDQVAWARALGVAAAALDGFVMRDVGLATHYHTYAVTPDWNRRLVMTAAVGAHLFHRWQGYWGTPAAFHQVYRGGEPIPGPLHPVAPPVSVPGAASAVVASAAAATTPPATIQRPPAAIASPEPGFNLPAESQVIDRWKDSGKPLR